VRGARVSDGLEEGGTSRMLSWRPVVGSRVEGWAGSWETWWLSMMYWMDQVSVGTGM